MPAPSDAEYFELGDVTLQSGHTLRGARLAYKTFGTLNADKSNVIVYPTWYSGWHTDNEWLVGTDKTLNPDEYFIVIPNMLGNGLSTSPSNAASPYDHARFPLVTFYDQVEAQHRLLTDVELPLQEILAHMEQRGIEVDVALLEGLPDAVIPEVLASRITMARGARTGEGGALTRRATLRGAAPSRSAAAISWRWRSVTKGAIAQAAIQSPNSRPPAAPEDPAAARRRDPPTAPTGREDGPEEGRTAPRRGAATG